MERDFMGAGRRDSKASGEKNARFRDLVFSPSSSKERARSELLNASSRMISYNAARRSYAEMLAQKGFCAGWHDFQNRQISSNPPWSTRSFNNPPENNSSDPRSFPVASNLPVHTASGSLFARGFDRVNEEISQIEYRKNPLTTAETGTTRGMTVPSGPNKQNHSQMTIFYGGRVNVFNNISIEKAQEIMFLASNVSKNSFNASHKTQMKVQASGLAPAVNGKTMNQNPLGTNKGRHCCDPPSPESVTSHSVSIPIDRFVNPNDSNPMSRAVPMARKASLARFLERRKDRISNMAPYLSCQNLVQIGQTSDEAVYSGKSLEPRMPLACSSNPSWCFNISKAPPNIVNPAKN